MANTSRRDKHLGDFLEARHGCGIGQRIQELTGGAVPVGPGTMSGTLSKMERDGLIRFTREQEKRKLYQISS